VTKVPEEILGPQECLGRMVRQGTPDSQVGVGEQVPGGARTHPKDNTALLLLQL
jgi:hypothetical protein